MRYIYIIVLYTLFSCKDKEIITPIDPPVVVEPPDTSVQLIWRKPLYDSLECVMEHTVIAGNDVVYRRSFIGPEGAMQKRNGLTGALMWSWSDPVVAPDGDINPIFSYKNQIVYNAGNYAGSIDATTGITQWKSRASYKDFTANIIGDYLYNSHVTGDIPFNRDGFLVRTQVSSPKWDTIFSFRNQKEYSALIAEPVLYRDTAGDSILIFKRSGLYFQSTAEVMDLVAFNLRSRKVVWQIEHLDAEGSSKVVPLVVGDKVYVTGKRTVFCVDATNGQVLWKKRYVDAAQPVGYYFFIGKCLLFAEGKLIVYASKEWLEALDPNTGKVLWENRKINDKHSNLLYYKGYIIYGADNLYFHRISDGYIAKAVTPVRPKPTDVHIYFYDQIAINEKNGYLYAPDNYFINCYKINLP